MSIRLLFFFTEPGKFNVMPRNKGNNNGYITVYTILYSQGHLDKDVNGFVTP